MVKRNAQLLQQVLALEQLEKLHGNSSEQTVESAIAAIYTLQNPHMHAMELDEVIRLSREQYGVEAHVQNSKLHNISFTRKKGRLQKKRGILHDYISKYQLCCKHV